eukprot:3571090-Pyramimonas_sp.AAC.1
MLRTAYARSRHLQASFRNANAGSMSQEERVATTRIALANIQRTFTSYITTYSRKNEVKGSRSNTKNRIIMRFHARSRTTRGVHGFVPYLGTCRLDSFVMEMDSRAHTHTTLQTTQCPNEDYAPSSSAHASLFAAAAPRSLAREGAQRRRDSVG